MQFTKSISLQVPVFCTYRRKESIFKIWVKKSNSNTGLAKSSKKSTPPVFLLASSISVPTQFSPEKSSTDFSRFFSTMMYANAELCIFHECLLKRISRNKCAHIIYKLACICSKKKFLPHGLMDIRNLPLNELFLSSFFSISRPICTKIESIPEIIAHLIVLRND